VFNGETFRPAAAAGMRSPTRKPAFSCERYCRKESKASFCPSRKRPIITSSFVPGKQAF